MTNIFVEDSNMDKIEKIIKNGYAVKIAFIGKIRIEAIRDNVYQAYAEDENFDQAVQKFIKQFVF